MTNEEWWKKNVRPYLPYDDIEWQDLTPEEQQEISDLRENVEKE